MPISMNCPSSMKRTHQRSLIVSCQTETWKRMFYCQVLFAQTPMWINWKICLSRLAHLLFGLWDSPTTTRTLRGRKEWIKMRIMKTSWKLMERQLSQVRKLPVLNIDKYDAISWCSLHFAGKKSFSQLLEDELQKKDEVLADLAFFFVELFM